MRRATLISSALCALACASPELRGAETARAGHEPGGREIASYRVADCRDAAGGNWQRTSRVRLLADPEGGELLVEQIPDYDSIVTRNRFAQRGERVFQAIVEDADRKPLLLDYRLPREGDGRMAAARQFVESETEEGALRGQVVRADYACRLVAVVAAPKGEASP